MPKIGDLPASVTRAGEDFNYAVWTAGTSMTLVNVPWNNDYRDIVKFDSQNALNTYINDNAGPVFNLTSLTYAPPGRPVRINLPFNAAYKYNYLRVSNPAQPIAGDMPRTFYYFVNDVRYVAPNTTELDIQLDVWQTFNQDVSFGRCYIERGHIGIANVSAQDDQGRAFLTVPEGLDIGGEYQIIDSRTKTIGSTEHRSGPSFDIIVATTVSLMVDPGDVDNPNLATAQGSTFQGIPNGAELYWFPNVDTFNDFVQAVSQKPWVSQGIIAIYAVPSLQDFQLNYATSTFEGVEVNKLYGEGYPETQNLMSDVNWKDSMMELLPSRYRHLRKFMTYPYSAVEVTTYSGTPIVLKPEGIPDEMIDIRMMLHLSPPGPRVALYPYRYNGSSYTEPDGYVDGAETEGGDNAEFLDMVTGIFNLPTFSLVNNSYISFLASNANGLAYQYQSADWSQQKAMMGAQTAYNQATAGMGLSTDQMNLSNRVAAQNTALGNQTAGYKALQSGVTGIVGGAATGGGAGAAAGALGAVGTGIGYAIDVNAANQSLAIQQNAARSGNTLNVNNMAYNRDTNLEMSKFAAQGDYENSIAAINAKVQDARLIQPTTAGQMGGDAFNLAMYRWAIHVKVKMLQSGYINTIGEYWLRYGYAVNRFNELPSDLHAMTNFTYWKLKETYLYASNCPEMFRQAIRGIFEKGVTVWRDPNQIGKIDIANNEPLQP